MKVDTAQVWVDVGKNYSVLCKMYKLLTATTTVTTTTTITTTTITDCLNRAFQWDLRYSSFPLECTGNCPNGTAVDYMFKVDMECPERISSRNENDIIESEYEICQARVR